MIRPQVLIVGAGPTGLVLALGLARRGIDLQIIDKKKGPGEASRAMAVQARTLEFYRQLGFADDVVSRGIKMEQMHMREGHEEAAAFQLGDIGDGLSPYPFVLSFPQDEHEKILVGELQKLGINVQWETELRSFVPHESEVSVVLVRHGVSEVAQFTYLCGCDGAHSVVRHGLHLEFPGGVYDQIFFVADVAIDAGQHTDFTMHLGATNFCLMLPIRTSGMWRLIGTVPKEYAFKEGLQFTDIQVHAEELMEVKVGQVNWFSRYQVHHRVASHFRVGRCFIAGDAGHVHSPAGGQGMNTGIGDAWNLAWKIADMIRGRADDGLLDTYEEERLAFAQTLVKTTDRAFRGITSESALGNLFRSFILPNMAHFLTGFTPVKRAMFRTISQTRIHYDGVLSEGSAGELNGGYRLPWVQLPDGDNFQALQSLDWQIHVYGFPHPELEAAAQKAGVPLHAYEWTDAAHEAGLKEDAFYLIRPDGYVALASATQDGEALAAYLTRHGLNLGQPSL